jgi:putative membrane protein
MLRTILTTAARTTAALTVSAALVTGAAVAQTDSADMPSGDTSANANTPADLDPGRSTESHPEADILKELHAANLAEIQEGRLAEEKATSVKVRRYGKLLAKDHTEADKLVMRDAQKLSVNLSDTLPDAQRSEVDALRSAAGPDFDRTFIADIEVAPKDNDTIRRLSDKLIPELRKHERDAQRLGNDVAKAP